MAQNAVESNILNDSKMTQHAAELNILMAKNTIESNILNEFIMTQNTVKSNVLNEP